MSPDTIATTYLDGLHPFDYILLFQVLDHGIGQLGMET